MSTTMQKWAVWPGKPYPLGAIWDGKGVNFALFSQHAEKVELCLFDLRGQHEIERISMRWQTDQVWHCYLPEGRPGLLYGYRVYGPYDPERGLRFNPNKLLLDPYAKDLWGPLRWSDALFAYKIGSPRQDLEPDHRDSAHGIPKSRVIDTAFVWGEDRPPRTPWPDTIIYELHVKGFTAQHPEIPPLLRGTYAGLATAPVLEFLKKLGVTAVELMPVHSCVNDRHLLERGLTNYWGYNPISFFSPEARYAVNEASSEFKTMVKTLHSAGLEVIIDVVYNHTAEGNHLGPMVSLRGIDNVAYYRLVPDAPRYYMDYTGCGHTLNTLHPRALQLIMDSLRYWVLEMHVDGFRFDLASALAREHHEVDRRGAFFDILCQDPVLCQVKLIAEPWDLGEGGYQVGNFPPGWAEWNGRYRDVLRAYWKGDGGLIGELAYRFAGSSDLYEYDGRQPHASINYVTSHDGFTLHDLVSYNRKHNELNREGNRDGEDHNISWNCGVEGPTRNAHINGLRARQKRNFLAILLLSQGVPMLLAGDETGRTQQGNNNAYCQDNAISWVNWQLTQEDEALLRFVQRVVGLRKRHSAFRRRHFFRGQATQGARVKDITWLSPEGHEMTDNAWNQSLARCLGLLLGGDAIGEVDECGRQVHDDNLLLLLNAHGHDIAFPIPRHPPYARWEVLIDTSYATGKRIDGRYFHSGESYPLKTRSLVLLVHLMTRHRPGLLGY